jgi:hypothetical protein
MAIHSGNLELVRWLASERCCPLHAAPTTRKKNSSLDNNKGVDTSIPLVTSKGRSPIQLALKHSVEILRYLVSEKKLSLLDQVTEESDVRFALHHLTFLLQAVPGSAMQSKARKERSSSRVKEANPIVAKVSVKAKARNIVQQYPTKQSLWLGDQKWDVDEAEDGIPLENVFDGNSQQVKVSEPLYRFMNENVSVEGTPFASCHSLSSSALSDDSMLSRGSF